MQPLSDIGAAPSAMAREICESADVVSQILRRRGALAEVARRLDVGTSPLVVALRSRKLRPRRSVLALPHGNTASPAGFRQRAFGDHGISQAADVEKCPVRRDLAIRAQS